MAGLTIAAMASAGGIAVLIGNPAANPEAAALHAVLVARVTACTHPEESAITAQVVQRAGAGFDRMPLRVVALSSGGTFAVLPPSSAQPNSVIELSITNPAYKDYTQHVLVRADASGIDWAGVKRFYKAPTDRDLNEMLTAATASR